MKIKKHILIAFMLAIALTSLIMMYMKSKSGEWYAMSRHGECVSLIELNKHSSLFAGAKNIDEMESIVKNEKIEYTRKSAVAGNSKFLSFDVPSEDVGLLLIKKENCKEFLND